MFVSHLFGYGFVALELLALAIWLPRRARPGHSTALFAGVVLAGSLFAAVLGAVLLPFALRGILGLGIGLLGLVPLFTAHVHYPAGMAAYRRPDAILGKQALFEVLVWGGVGVDLIPARSRQSARTWRERRCARSSRAMMRRRKQPWRSSNRFGG